MEINDVTLGAGDFVSKVYRQRLAMALTPQVLANVFVQYNDLSQVASVNARFNWHYRPGLRHLPGLQPDLGRPGGERVEPPGSAIDAESYPSFAAVRTGPTGGPNE